jgi:hypothetical protein
MEGTVTLPVIAPLDAREEMPPPPVTQQDVEDITDAVIRQSAEMPEDDDESSGETGHPPPSDVASLWADIRPIIEEQKRQREKATAVETRLDSFSKDLHDLKQETSAIATSIQSLTLKLDRMAKVEAAVHARAKRDAEAAVPTETEPPLAEPLQQIHRARMDLASSSAPVELKRPLPLAGLPPAKRFLFRDE